MFLPEVIKKGKTVAAPNKLKLYTNIRKKNDKTHSYFTYINIRQKGKENT